MSECPELLNTLAKLAVLNCAFLTLNCVVLVAGVWIMRRCDQILTHVQMRRGHKEATSNTPIRRPNDE